MNFDISHLEKFVNVYATEFQFKLFIVRKMENAEENE